MNKYRKLSQPLAILLAASLCWTAGAADCQASSGLVQMQVATKTKLDISKGDIEIGVSKISGLSPEGKRETQVNRDGYHIVGETDTYSIKIEAGVTAEILLENVNISQVDTDAYALKIEDASEGDVTLTLRGYNVLKGGSHCAGVEKGCNQTSCVRGGSQCDCGTLTIRCERYKEEGHVCDADCGTLIASGVNGGAGIGGGDGRKANRIEILGGHISASGGYGSAGIGGGYFCEGSHVRISGGEVTAVAGEGNVALGGLDGSEEGSINGDCIVEAGSMGGITVYKGIVLNGNSGTINGAVNITKNGAAGILKDKKLTREDGGRLLLPEGVAWTVQNTLRVLDPSSVTSSNSVLDDPEEEQEDDTVSGAQTETRLQRGADGKVDLTSAAKGTYGQTLSQLEVTDHPIEGDIAGTWSWAAEEEPDKTYPIVNGTTSYVRVFTPEDPDQKEVRVKILPQMSYLETTEKVSILSPTSPDGENGWYKGNVVLEAPDGYQAFHSRSVGWVEELVVADDGGSGDYEYYLREVGTNLTTGVKKIRLNIDSLPPIIESVTVMHVGAGMRIRARAKDDTSRTEQVSGTRYFYCLVQPESGIKSMGRKTLIKNKETKNNTIGEFTYTDLEAGKRYQLFVVAADKAGNLSEVDVQTFTAQ